MKPFHKKKTAEFIEQLLLIKPELQDNDERLVSNVMLKFLQLGNICSHDISAWKLLEMYAKNELPTVDYITRIRRKVQENNPDLRGETWIKRQKKSVKVSKLIIINPINEVL